MIYDKEINAIVNSYGISIPILRHYYLQLKVLVERFLRFPEA